MNDKDDLVFIEHILDSINAIGEFSKNLVKEELESDRLRQSAIVRRIEELEGVIATGTRTEDPEQLIIDVETFN
jgi:uncharacterized protein with HEPN domain